jgi:DNA-binding LacI/PurR family transcriptional regulator
MTTRATILSLIERLNHSPNSSALKLRNGYDYNRHTVTMHKYKIGPFEREPTVAELVHDYVKLLTDLVGR